MPQAGNHHSRLHLIHLPTAGSPRSVLVAWTVFPCNVSPQVRAGAGRGLGGRDRAVRYLSLLGRGLAAVLRALLGGCGQTEPFSAGRVEPDSTCPGARGMPNPRICDENKSARKMWYDETCYDLFKARCNMTENYCFGGHDYTPPDPAPERGEFTLGFATALSIRLKSPTPLVVAVGAFQLSRMLRWSGAGADFPPLQRAADQVADYFGTDGNHRPPPRDPLLSAPLCTPG